MGKLAAMPRLGVAPASGAPWLGLPAGPLGSEGGEVDSKGKQLTMYQM